MVMYIETKDGRPTDATTLEEAAEELLNGLLCHYEPPDPRSIKKMQQDIDAQKKGGNRGILRASTKLFRTRRSRRRSSKSVRWKDEQNKSKTPDIYDIGQGCREALAECASSEADGNLERETEKLAELSQQRAPKPISKRIKKDRESRDDSDRDRYASADRANTSAKAEYSEPANKYEAPNDPVSSYRNATQSPKESSDVDDAPDDGTYDDQGNLVVQEENANTPSSNTPSKFGPSPSPAPPQRTPRREERRPRQQTPYKQRSQESRPQQSPMQQDPTTLCGIMCDPKFLNCEIADGDYSNHTYDGYLRPPPPPPPLPERAKYYYQYEEPANSLISESDGEQDEEDEIVETPRTKKGFRDRFQRKSRRSSGSRNTSEEEKKASGQQGRGRSRSPGRRGRSPGRSKSPGRSTKQGKKYTMSPLSFITGNRSFSRSPRAKAAKAAERSESEANYSVQSTGSSTVSKRKTSKSPLRRKWFGSGRKPSRDDGLTPTNSDWDYPGKRALMDYAGDDDGRNFPSRDRSLERRDQLAVSRSHSYDQLDYADRSAFDGQDRMLRATRSRSLDRQDRRGRQRLVSYERAESNIGLSRMSFDEEEMLRQTRSRSLDRSDQLRPSRSRSLERHDAQLRPSRSRSLDRQDQRSNSRIDGRTGVTFEQPGYDPRLLHTTRSRSMENEDPYLRARSPSYDGQLDLRRSSYPLQQPQNGVGARRPLPVPPQQPPHWQQQPASNNAREDYLDQHGPNFVPQRVSSYPSQPPQGPFDPTPRRSFEYSEPRSRNHSWWGARRSNSMEQRKTAAEPPAAVYTHEPQHYARPVQQVQPNSIYSHDPQVARPPTVTGREMPPTPTQRDSHSQYPPHEQQFADAPQFHYVDPRQMPPTPAQRAVIYPPDNRVMYDQYNQQHQTQQHQQLQKKQEPQRDPTPRNRSLIDFVRSPLRNEQPVRPPSPPHLNRGPASRPFNVAEEIHRVSWGEAPRRDITAESNIHPPPPELAPEPYDIEHVDSSCCPAAEVRQGIPSNLPGKEKAPPPPPPPPPPPRPQAMPQKPPPQHKKPPRPMAQEMLQIPENKVTNSSKAQFNDLVNENRALPAEQKNGKGRTLLGLFGRNKRKSAKRPSTNNRYQVRANDDVMNNDGSIISDAILRDRHDRFVTKL